MKTAAFPTIGTLDRSLPATSDPMYQTAALSLTIHDIIKAISDAGMQIEVVENADLTTIESDLRGFGDDFDTWIGLAATASTAGLSIPPNPALPPLTTLIPALLAGGWAAIIPVIINLIIDVIVRYIERRLDPDTTTDELASLLAEKLSNDDGRGIGGIFEDYGIARNAADERYSQLWNLARQATRIIVDTDKTYDDVILEDSS